MKIVKKTLDLITRFIVPIDFVLAACFAFSIYRIVFIKNYLGFFPPKYIIVSILFVIFTICALYVQIKKDKTAFHRIVILLIIPVGMMYIFFIPPTFVPDEQTHMLKSYEASTGKLITDQTSDDAPTIEMPRFFENRSIDNIDKYDKFNLALKEKTDYTNTKKVQTSAAGYCFVSYLFSSLGFLIGRTFSINGLLAFYLARIFNYSFFIFAIYESLKFIPFGKYIIVVFSFLPMTLQQAASLSPDSMLISCSIIYIAMTLYIKYKSPVFKTWEKIIYSSLCILIMLSMAAYFPLLGMSLLLLKTNHKQESIRRRWTYLIFNVILAIGIGYVWFKYSQSYNAPDIFKEFYAQNHVNPTKQIKMILSDPEHLGLAIQNFFISNAGLLIETVGLHLGWLNINIGMGPVIAFIIMLAISPFFDTEALPLTGLERGWICIITASIYLIIMIGFYITWTGIGADKVAGTQGRYFLPVLVLPFLAAYNKKSQISYKYQVLVFPIILVILEYLVLRNVTLFFL